MKHYHDADDLWTKCYLTKANWPAARPGLDDELARIVREHADREVSARIHGPLIGFLLLSGATCFFLWQSADGRADRAESEYRELLQQTRSLAEGVQRLRSEIERFDFENWRDVVPDVRDMTDDLASQADDLPF